MFYLVLSLHIFLCLALVVLVLLQQGKGASAGAVLGGSSNTLFGASGANTVLTKVTTGFAIAFMFTSVVLVRLYSSHAQSRVGDTNPLQGSVMSERVAAPAQAAAEGAVSDGAVEDGASMPESDKAQNMTDAPQNLPVDTVQASGAAQVVEKKAGSKTAKKADGKKG
jgi:preprotein translocase subunit SecG